ncbi:hypothetical protein M9Y10_010210 [Tritrichomonas musculus]|uniref:beta-glucosidase n=1 Tax=Tritrichomonas musculus TaxID=1915356 RepID=A0ABR2IRY0_9EUKA
MGKVIGREMKKYHVHLWLAPGMNIHCNPLCGRNFEYFSEDPVLSGLCGYYETKGVQSFPGMSVTIKHFAANRNACYNHRLKNLWNNYIRLEYLIRLR